MIITRLKLENIRSYIKAEIDFPLGKTLFEGDVGSGKSTILMAIEFALFGLGSEKGAALLRAGVSKGAVSLTFDIDGRQYTIERTLVKKRGVIEQKAGSITDADGKVMHYSAGELKGKVLKILNFNEPPNPTAHSVIYRYAVFTPQEEMKAILFLSSDIRLQTLRKAFRIEDYRIAIENSRHLLAEIEKKTNKLEAETSDVPELQKKIHELHDQISGKQKELNVLNSARQDAETLLKGLSSEREVFRKEEVKLSRLTGVVAPLEDLIRNKPKQIDDDKEQIKRLEKKLGQLQPKVKELEEIENPTDKSSEQLKEEIKELEKEEKGLLKIEANVDSKIGDYRAIQESGVCPTCDRPANPEEFAGKIMLKMAEKEKVSRNMHNCGTLLERTKGLLEKKSEYESAQKGLEGYREKLGEYAIEIGNLNNSIASAQKEIDDANKRLEDAKQNLVRFEEVSKKVEVLDQKMETANKNLHEVGNEISVATTKISGWTDQIEELQKQVKKKQELQKKVDALKEYRIWLEDYFIPTLDLIEKQVMLNINQDFNIHFQKWFSMLVEDAGKEARIDEEFTPIVHQNGYEQDIYYLSGGEKTSVALAYRLALNTIVQRISTGMHSNLLILDEPTDGFSKEQLAKVREVLDEIQSPQVIIVSHEKELESFADQVFRITKVQGESKILTN